MPPRLSFAAAEARQLVGKLPEAKQRALQLALVELCEARWREIRGPEPAAILAHELWSVVPPLAELFADLHAAADERIEGLLDGIPSARAIALLVLAEIERGDADGVHVAHEAMMAFESPAARRVYQKRVALALRGGLEARPLHRHSSREPLWKALAIIADYTGRHDLRALTAVIGLLAAPSPAAQADPALERLREALNELGVRFLGVNARTVHVELHGHEHRPVSRKHLADLIAEIRQQRLG